MAKAVQHLFCFFVNVQTKINDFIQELETFEGGMKIFLTHNSLDIKSLPDNLKKWIFEKYNCDDFDCYFYSPIGLSRG